MKFDKIKRGSLVKTPFGRMLVVNKGVSSDGERCSVQGYELAGNKKGYRVANFQTWREEDIEVFDTAFELKKDNVSPSSDESSGVHDEANEVKK